MIVAAKIGPIGGIEVRICPSRLCSTSRPISPIPSVSSEKVSPSADSGKRLPCLSDGLEFHLIAQTGELANEAFLRSFTIPFFKEGFPFLQIGGLVTEKVIDNDQDTVSDGDSSSFGPATFGDSAILLSQIALLLMRGRMSSLHEQAS